MNELDIIFKAFGKVIFNFLPAFIFTIGALPVLYFSERRDEYEQRISRTQRTN